MCDYCISSSEHSTARHPSRSTAQVNDLFEDGSFCTENMCLFDLILSNSFGSVRTVEPQVGISDELFLSPINPNNQLKRGSLSPIVPNRS